MIKLKLSLSLFDWKEIIEYNGSHDAFVNEKAGNSALNRTLKATDSTNDMLNKETACDAFLLILIKAIIVSVSKVDWIQRSIIVTWRDLKFLQLGTGIQFHRHHE